MSAIVFTVQKDANDYATAVDTKYGYPRNGTDIGGGIHAAKAESQTLRHADVIKHPTLALYAYMDATPSDTSTQKTVPDVALPGTGTKQTLDATWFPTIIP